MTQVVGEVNRQKICRVCSDRAMGFNFNAITCESCKAFFRRNAFKTEKLRCPFNNDCIIDKSTRRFCQKCRLEKCLQVGMKREWILSEEQKKIKRAKIAENRLKRKSDGNDEPTDEKSRKSNDKTRDSTVVDHPTSSSFSPSCSSSSSSQYGDDNNSTCAYKFSADNSNPSIFTTSLTRQEGSSVYDFSLDSLLASKPNQLNPSSSFKETSSIFGTNDTPIDLGPPERYNHLKPLTTTTHSVDRDSLDANWVSLITDPSTSQSIRKSCFISHILDSNKANCYNHHDGNSENMEDTANSNLHLCSSPASVLLSLTSPDNVRSQLEPINNKSNNNQELDEREESWRLKVNHRILEANFMPIYLRNTQEDCSSLNELETLKINELVQSFSAIDEPILDHSCVEGSGISDVIKFSDLAIRRLIKWCKKIHAFSSLCLEDQMALLKAGCLEMLSMKASFNFNVDDESWQDAYTKNGVKLTVFRQASEKLYQAHRQFIKTFNQRWRTDHKVNLLLVAIVLFNPDRPNLLHPATVRLEHYTYIYLLRRYLETKSDSLCQARSDHYHLMMKIEDLRELHEKTLRLYSDAGPEVVGPLLIEILDLK